MRRDHMVEILEEIMCRLTGEQFSIKEHDDGDVDFLTFIGPVPITLRVERWTDDDVVVVGYHVLGVRVLDRAAAAEWVAKKNDSIRIGKLRLYGDSVVFRHYVFSAGINVEVIRELINLLTLMAKSGPDLTAATGALRVQDIAGLG